MPYLLDNGKKIKIGKERKYINHSSMILVLILDFVDTKLILVYKHGVDLKKNHPLIFEQTPSILYNVRTSF